MATVSATPTNGKPATTIELPDFFPDECRRSTSTSPPRPSARRPPRSSRRWTGAALPLSPIRPPHPGRAGGPAKRLFQGMGQPRGDHAGRGDGPARHAGSVDQRDDTGRTEARAMKRPDAEAREQWEAVGYAEGLAAGRREGSGYAGPLD